MNEQQIPSRSELPPLRIHHFLTWTAVLAGMFAILDWSQLFDREQPHWAIAVLVVGHVLGSAAIACFGFGIAWWWRGLKFPSEPGHWIVIQTGLATISYQALLAIVSAFVNPQELELWRAPYTIRFLIDWMTPLHFRRSELR